MDFNWQNFLNLLYFGDGVAKNYTALPSDTTQPIGGEAFSRIPADRKCKPSRVEFLKLGRDERENVVVLPSAEKYQYALTTLEPLLNQLWNLSSEIFYEQLARWDHLLSSSSAIVDTSAGHDWNSEGQSETMKHNDSENSFYDLFKVDSGADDAIADVDADTHPRYVSHDVFIVPQSSPACVDPPQTNLYTDLS
ncbi:hypothetical protein L916_01480 [Phytophthora nicotianae]|uniref:Uncharacterized protein n=1 Tax=Phytophthora nicotianae TaxID=4792 RepID=W2JRH2_PHYNI|nr:hypothetical protein L916_01480 [Phytophthora nicotianae]